MEIYMEHIYLEQNMEQNIYGTKVYIYIVIYIVIYIYIYTHTHTHITKFIMSI